MSTVKKFSATEKAVFAAFAIIMSVSALVLLWNVNQNFLVPVPARGGTLSEGVIGTPRFINPVLALNDVDRDLTSLVYSGLMKVENGELVPDLAKKYVISPDGLTYTFTLKDNLVFQDGTPITTDDVEFTVQKAQDALLNSPKRANWDGIVIEKISASQIRFVLKKPYAPFIENTTMGILPKHIWKNVDVPQFTFSQFNIQPIGSGPYIVKNINRDSGGLPQSYELVPFKKYVGGEAYISSLVINFYPDESSRLDAYKYGSIESMNSVSSQDATDLKSDTTNIVTAPLPRVFGVFFNQTQAPVLANKEVRQALDMALDREAIVADVLGGYGTEIYSPIPAGIMGSGTSTPPSAVANLATSTRISSAKKILEQNGWTLNANGVYEKKSKKDTQTLEFSLSTSNAPELKKTADLIKQQWAAIGANVTVKIFETGDLNQNVIRARKYDALLFGEIIGRDLDLFAFWHSSQRNDPGLNIALYANSKVDKLLEDARTIADNNRRLDKYSQVEDAIAADIPAVFTYSPDFIYILPERVQGVTINHITTPEDRFNGINKWYIDTDQVWKVFVNN